MKKLSQKERIKNHLTKFKCITTMEAFVKYRITRLSAHIHSLRGEGMYIRSQRIENKKAGTWHNKFYI